MLRTKKTYDINRIHKRKLKHQPQANDVVNNVNQTMPGAEAGAEAEQIKLLTALGNLLTLARDNATLT